MSQRIIGLIMILIGFSMVYKTDGYLGFLGRNDWAEEHFAGGTRFFYKLIGCAISFLGVLGVAGVLQGALFDLLTKLFGPK